MTMRDKTDVLLNRVATLASALLVTVFVGTLLVIVWPRIAAATGSRPTPPPPAYAAGDVIDVPAEWYRGSARTLVLFGQASCGACQDAKPFLQQLVSTLHGRTAVVVASPGNALADDTAWAAAIGIPGTAVHAVPGRLRVRVTPTLVIVNQQGEILGAWEGIGPPDKHADLAHAINQALGR